MEADMTILRRRVEEIVAILGVNKPIDGASTDELAAWIEWWKPSLESARNIPSDRVAYLRAGGWWPPVSAEQIARVPPPIVTRSLRPNLHKSQQG